MYIYLFFYSIPYHEYYPPVLDEDLKNKIIKCDKWTMLHLKGSADNNHVYPIIHDKKRYNNWNYF